LSLTFNQNKFIFPLQKASTFHIIISTFLMQRDFVAQLVSTRFANLVFNKALALNFGFGKR